jgi:hypothetical protein
MFCSVNFNMLKMKGVLYISFIVKKNMTEKQCKQISWILFNLSNAVKYVQVCSHVLLQLLFALLWDIVFFQSCQLLWFCHLRDTKCPRTPRSITWKWHNSFKRNRSLLYLLFQTSFSSCFLSIGNTLFFPRSYSMSF